MSDILKSNQVEKKKTCSFFIANEIIPYNEYIINNEYKPWNVTIPLSHSDLLYSLYVYVFIKKGDDYICIAKNKSPNFHIYSPKRKNERVDIFHLEDEVIKLPTYSIEDKKKKYDSILLSLSDESIKIKNNNKKKEENYVIKTSDEFNSLAEYFHDVEISKPNTQYRSKTNFSITKISTIDTDSKREEIAFCGRLLDDLSEDIDHSIEFIDSKGNLCNYTIGEWIYKKI